jgi:hypothetical protein
LESVSDAELSAGTWRMETNRGLLPCSKRMLENHMGGVLGVSKGWTDDSETGIRLGRVSRAGKWDMRGVPGGGRMSENLDARVNMGDYQRVGERAVMKLAPASKAATRNCGVMS